MPSSGRRAPELQAVFSLALCFIFFDRPILAAGADLNGAQITGVVIGSVAGALLVVLVTYAVCCVRAQRRRQTGDLSWAKAADLESAAPVGAAGHIPHELLPAGPPTSTGSTIGAVREPGPPDSGFGSGSSPDGVDGVARSPGTPSAAGGADAPSVSVEAVRASPSADGFEYTKMPSRGRRSVGGGLVAFSKALKRGGGGGKDKNLEVSRSQRVEPSAELEMAESFEPANTNMGPPLSKSSMLLRWLNGADDGTAEAVAAAAAAAAAGAADGGASGAISRSGRSHTVGRVGAGTDGAVPFLDRVPLLSLAAQQSGIVWSKMPPSVASSPAISLAESSSMHMLKRTWKRSDAAHLEEAALKVGLDSSSIIHGGSSGTAAAAKAALLAGGDDRYPPSLALASVEALRRRNSLNPDRPGIVFGHLSSTPSNSRAPTSGGASSRVPTIGGAVLPVSTGASSDQTQGPATTGAALGGGAGGVSAFGGFGGGAVGGIGQEGLAAAVAAAAAAIVGDDEVAAVGGPSRASFASSGIASLPSMGGGALLGGIPDENIFVQVRALQQRQQLTAAAQDSARRSSGVWLHQAPPAKLTALQEAEGEGEGAEGGAPAAVPTSSSTRPPAARPTPAHLELPPSPVPQPSQKPSQQQQQPLRLPQFYTEGPGAAGAPSPATAETIFRVGAGAGGQGSQQTAGWTHFSDGGSVWQPPRVAVDDRNGVSGTGTGAEPPLSANGQSTHGSVGALSGMTSPLSPFLPHPPPDASGNICVNGSGGTAAQSKAASSGMAPGGLHHIALRSNSAVQTMSIQTAFTGKSSGLSGSETDASEADGAIILASAAAAAAAAERGPAAPAPSMRQRAGPPAPVVPPSHSASAASLKSAASVSPSIGLHFPEMPLPWTTDPGVATPPSPYAGGFSGNLVVAGGNAAGQAVVGGSGGRYADSPVAAPQTPVPTSAATSVAAAAAGMPPLGVSTPPPVVVLPVSARGQ